MKWDDVAAIFEEDGTLRDIYVRETTVADWDRVIRLFAAQGRVVYLCDGKEAPLPGSARAIFDDRAQTHCLKLDLGGPVVHAYFFVPHEIELDLDPREINSQRDLDLVLAFCARLAEALNRDVRITPESAPDRPDLWYVLRNRTWQVCS